MSSGNTSKFSIGLKRLLMDINCGLWILSAVALALFILVRDNPKYDSLGAGALIFLIAAFLITAQLSHLTGDKIFGWATTGMAVAWIAGAFLISDTQNYAILFYISVTAVAVIGIWRSFIWFSSERRGYTNSTSLTGGSIPTDEKITPR